jgi:thymidylate synthase ThyX
MINETSVKVMAYTQYADELNTQEMMEFSGKAAGVCYMTDNYLVEGIEDTEKAIKRAKSTAKRGHQSVFDHCNINYLIHTNKAMAMVLNSLGVYTTSEKSARYTVMNPETRLEFALYHKWKDRINTLILMAYPDMNDTVLESRLNKEFDNNIKVAKGKIESCLDKTIIDKFEQLKKANDLPSCKLAQEKARYMISVFTPTIMMYTMSYRQTMLVIDYLRKLSEDCKKSSEIFYIRLGEYASELSDKFESIIGEKVLGDIKNQGIRLFENIQGDKGYVPKKEVTGDSYTLRYKMTFAGLAQELRHRTIRHSMELPINKEYIVPEIIKQAGFDKEWLSDIKSVEYCVPQGTLVNVTEQGIFEDFALKCKERLCGRAQLEITRTIAKNLDRFSADNLCDDNLALLSNMLTVDECGNIQVLYRCQFKDFKCTDGCRWGAKGFLDRYV